MTQTAFVDIETTGLYPALGAEPWEVAMILRDDEDMTERRFIWQLPVDLGKADPMSLSIGRFHERRWAANPWNRTIADAAIDGDPSAPTAAVIPVERMGEWARRFCGLTVGATWVGAVPDFDATRFLDPLLRRHGACPGWHYHLRDVEALAVGWLNGRSFAISRHGTAEDYHWARSDSDYFSGSSWKSDALSAAIGVDPDRFARHSAMGDVEWAMAIYDAVMGTGA